VRRFYSALQARGVRPDNPATSVKAPEPDALTDKPITYLAESQLQQLIEVLPTGDTAHELRDRAIVLLMALHGLRVVEVVRLRVDEVQITPDGMALRVRGKRHARIVHVRPDVARVVERYMEARTHIATPELFVGFSTRCPGRRLCRMSVRRIVDKYLRAVGAKRARVSCHALRHTAATLGYYYTRDLRAVQTMLGHRDPITTARYAHLVDARESNPANKIPVTID
jgi:integrase/recombinase XerD